MRLTIEFDPEAWRIEYWWHRKLCAWFGHPAFKEYERRLPRLEMFAWLFVPDDRPRCTRCGVPDPRLPVPVPTARYYDLGDPPPAPPEGWSRPTPDD